MKILKSISSVLFKEGLANFIKRKRNITFLDNRTLYKINYNNKIVKIFLNKKFGYLDNYIFYNGIYERDIIDNIRNTLKKDSIILDIGSNIGQHSLLLSPYCKKIFAFEPIPQVYNEFKNSIKANKYKNINLQNIAIGDKKESKSIFFNQKNTGSSTFLDQNLGHKTIQVNIDKLENVLPLNQKFDVVKIDVEGYEAIVILSNKEIFLKNKPIIFLEFCPDYIKKEGTYKAEDLVNFFFENKYKIYKGNTTTPLTRDSIELTQTANWVLKPISCAE